MCGCETDVAALWRELRAAQRELMRWRTSEHPTIIEQCEDRVIRARKAIFMATGTFNNEDDL